MFEIEINGDGRLVPVFTEAEVRAMPFACLNEAGRVYDGIFGEGEATYVIFENGAAVNKMLEYFGDPDDMDEFQRSIWYGTAEVTGTEPYPIAIAYLYRQRAWTPEFQQLPDWVAAAMWNNLKNVD